VAELADVANAGKRLFWLHDYFSICPSFTLQRNSVAFCGAPPPGSNACHLCLFGQERRDHQKRMAVFFDRFRPHLLSPSAVTLAFWKAKSGLPAETATVAPHMILEWVPKIPATSSDMSAPVVVGYLGHPVPHKGWPLFDALAAEFGDSSRYKFVALGVTRPDNAKVKWTKVRVTTEHETAMSDAVRAAGIDIVLHWPTWPETFSLTTYEALTGGAFVLTNEISGNVAATVNEHKKGKVLADKDAVFAFFAGDQAETLALAARQLRRETSVTSRLSDVSAPFLSKRK
jgi:glycosyltransferase involved in cell wall biosynthesis